MYLVFLLLLGVLELDLIAAQKLVLTWQLCNVGLLRMRKPVTWLQCVF